MDESEQYDEMLFAMLKECKTLPVFLDHIFGFLKRRTDFYYVATEPGSPIGLPPGMAEATVRNNYLKYVDQEDETTRSRASSSVKEKTAPDISQNRDKKMVTHKTLTSANNYNGATYDTYSWTQSYNEIDVTVKLPEGTKPKDLKVTINPNFVSITTLNNKVLVEGELCRSCKHTDAIWSIDKDELQIHLEKSKEIWWNCFLTSEPKLNISKMDCTKPMEDLPEDAQAKIYELQWNQEQKRLGLPTSDQIKLENTLKKAWNVEGSPFSGPYDPSAVIIN